MKFNSWYLSSFLISFVVLIPIITVFTSFFENTSNYYEILKSLDSVTSFSLYRLSVCYEKIGDYEKSIKHLNEIISNDPLYEKAWISIAKYYLRKNDHDKALENLNKALNIIANNY